MSVPVEKRKYWLLTAMNALNASMPANPRQNGTVSNRQPTAMTAMKMTRACVLAGRKGEWVYDVTQAVTMGAFVGMSDANVLISSRVPLAGVIAVGYRLLTAPFCEGFAGIEAFCAFLAVATHRVCQPRQESLFERNAAG